MRDKRYYHWLIYGVVLAALYFCSFYNYLLFHTLAELFTIIIAFSIFTIGWSSRRYHESPVFLWISISYFTTGVLDILHTLAYKGMQVFPVEGANTATQLWIAARYLQGISFVAIVIWGRKVNNYRWLAAGYGLVVALLIASIFVFNIFPDCYVEGYGLTLFKIYSEYLISLMFLTAIIFFFRQQLSYNRTVLRGIIGSLCFTILSELAFTTYFSVFSTANAIGHLLRVVAYFILYEALVEISLNQPYEVLFRDLKQNRDVLLYLSTHDALTGLYNRRYFEDELRRLDEQGPFPVGVLILDVNDLKKANDQLGHAAGDQILKDVADALMHTFRSSDMVARIGGDEFAVLLPNSGLAEAQEAVRRLNQHIEIQQKKGIALPVAIGMAVAVQPGGLMSANHRADQDMYANKLAQKNLPGKAQRAGNEAVFHAGNT